MRKYQHLLLMVAVGLIVGLPSQASAFFCAIGDSKTAATEANGYQPWPSYFPDIVNLGIGGTTTRDWTNHLEPLLEGCTDAVIWLGHNDWMIPDNTTSDTITRLVRLDNQFKRAFFLVPDGRDDMHPVIYSWVKKLRKAMVPFCRRHTCRDRWISNDGYADPQHLNAQGSELIAQVIKELL